MVYLEQGRITAMDNIDGGGLGPAPEGPAPRGGFA